MSKVEQWVQDAAKLLVDNTTDLDAQDEEYWAAVQAAATILTDAYSRGLAEGRRVQREADAKIADSYPLSASKMNDSGRWARHGWSNAVAGTCNAISAAIRAQASEQPPDDISALVAELRQALDETTAVRDNLAALLDAPPAQMSYAARAAKGGVVRAHVQVIREQLAVLERQAALQPELPTAASTAPAPDGEAL